MKIGIGIIMTTKDINTGEMIMKRETLKALKGSIEKWEDIINEGNVDLGGSNCPLCNIGKGDCAHCPVFEETREPECWGTPYEKWMRHQDKIHHKWAVSLKIECKICERFAKQEVEFLKSLLPK